MQIVKFSLKNSLLLNLLTALAVIVAIIKTMAMHREAFPAINFDIVTVNTIYPGSSPKEVELYVTDPIEDEIESIDGLEEITSTSIEGMSVIVIKLDPDRSDRRKNATVAEIQRAVDRVRTLPKEVEDPPLVKELSSGDMPVIELAITGKLPYDTLHKIADDLGDRIKELKDAKDTRKNGFRQKEFWVELDPKKLQRNYVGLTQVIGILSASNLNLPGGVLKSPEGEYLVRTVGELNTPEEVDDIVIRTNDAGIQLKIKDIGKTKTTFEEENKKFRVNGTSSINLLILKKASGDIISLVDQVKETVKKYKKISPYGKRLKVSYINDMSVFVKKRLGVLLNNGLFGIVLVLISLLLFLSKGIAFVAAVGMPVAFLGALLVMSLTGMTVNLITMFALVIVLGMLVDDAIIVAENIWQHYEMGESPWNATVKGTSEVFWPVTATILTTIAAFSPMLMVSGIFGKFIANMPKVVMVALVISLIEAMFILPTHGYDVLRWGEKFKKKSKPAKDKKPNEASLRTGMVKKATEFYGLLLTLSLRARYLFFLFICSVLAACIYLAKTEIKFILFPNDGIEAFFIRAELPNGTSLETTSKKIRVFENLISEKIPINELKDHVTTVGVHENDANDPLKSRGTHLGQVGVFLVPEIERERSADEIIESVREDLQRTAKENGFKKLVFTRLRHGPPVGKPVAIRVLGPDLDELSTISDQIQDDLRTLPGVSDIAKNFLPGKEELQIIVNEKAAAEALLSVREVALHVRTLLEGQIASYVRLEGDRIPIRIRYQEKERKLLSAVENSLLTNSRGILVPLKKVVHFQKRPGLSAIIHRNGKRAITITAAIDENKTTSTEVNTSMLPYINKIEKSNPNIAIEMGGEYEDTENSMASLTDAFYVALGLIFLILATQFQSLTQPFVVMMAIPFGIIGVIISFYIHTLPLSFLAFIGTIGLSGVVVNDSIVLVDFVNKARKRGMGAIEACVYAGKRRFRAVWLTSITTIFGLLPLVYGIGGTDKFLRPAALALGYGLVFATFLILFFVPAMYLMRIDLLTPVLGKFMEKETQDSPEPHLRAISKNPGDRHFKHRTKQTGHHK